MNIVDLTIHLRHNNYNLAHNPGKTTDLSVDPAHDNVRQSLRQMLHERLGYIRKAEERLTNCYDDSQLGGYDCLLSLRAKPTTKDLQ